jgi:hypothetical protein
MDRCGGDSIVGNFSRAPAYSTSLFALPKPVERSGIARSRYDGNDRACLCVKDQLLKNGGELLCECATSRKSKHRSEKRKNEDPAERVKS